MKNRKVLFFDVDGTLLSEKTGEIPGSAKAALKEARSNGHLVFINSGRTYCNLLDIRNEIGADGYLCGCGTHVLAGDQVIYRYSIPPKAGSRMKQDILECGLDGVLEGAEGCYMRKEESRFPRVEKLRRGLGAKGVLSSCAWDDGGFQFDKCFLLSDSDSSCGEFLDRMEAFMEVIDHGDGSYECVPKGHSKATAIRQVLKHYDIPLENAYVFGDSSNDLSMFEYASNCVVMGDHSPVLDPHATFVTRSVEEDGIAYAMKQLGIIGGVCRESLE